MKHNNYKGKCKRKNSWGNNILMIGKKEKLRDQVKKINSCKNYIKIKRA